MAIKDLNVLDQYKLFFADSSFTFPVIKRLIRKHLYTVLIMISLDIFLLLEIAIRRFRTLMLLGWI